MFTRHDWTGRYGMLTVLSFKLSADRESYWAARCDCGTDLVVTGGDLRHRRRRGTLDSMQCDECGPRQKGDGYLRGKWNLWSRTSPGVATEWEDFVTFRSAVGRRRAGHAMCWPNRSKPFGPGNWCWAKGDDRLKYMPSAKLALVDGEWLTLGQRRRRNGITLAHYHKRRQRGWTPDEAVGPKDYRGGRRRYKPKPKRKPQPSPRYKGPT